MRDLNRYREREAQLIRRWNWVRERERVREWRATEWFAAAKFRFLFYFPINSINCVEESQWCVYSRAHTVLHIHVSLFGIPHHTSLWMMHTQYTHTQCSVFHFYYSVPCALRQSGMAWWLGTLFGIRIIIGVIWQCCAHREKRSGKNTHSIDDIPSTWCTLYRVVNSQFQCAQKRRRRRWSGQYEYIYCYIEQNECILCTKIN